MAGGVAAQPRPPREGAGRDGRPAPQSSGARKPQPAGPARQPDPLRTGIDALNDRGRRNRNKNRGGGGKGGGGGGGIDPLRTSFGRIQ